MSIFLTHQLFSWIYKNFYPMMMMWMKWPLWLMKRNVTLTLRFNNRSFWTLKYVDRLSMILPCRLDKSRVPMTKNNETICWTLSNVYLMNDLWAFFPWVKGVSLSWPVPILCTLSIREILSLGRTLRTWNPFTTFHMTHTYPSKKYLINPYLPIAEGSFSPMNSVGPEVS